MTLLAEWIKAGRLRADEFASHRFRIEHIAEAFAVVGRNEAIKVILTF